MADNTYNGWTNWKTFAVGNSILNSESFYLMACRYERGAVYPTWKGFVEAECLAHLTVDGVSLDDPDLDDIELGEVIQEINA